MERAWPGDLQAPPAGVKDVRVGEEISEEDEHEDAVETLDASQDHQSVCEWSIRSSILWLATRSPAWPLLAPRIHHPLPNQLHLDRIQASESILAVQDGLLYLAGVLEESNDIVASRANPAIPESLKLLLAVEPSSLLRETRNFLIMRGLR